jgi:hypothetical protein
MPDGAKPKPTPKAASNDARKPITGAAPKREPRQTVQPRRLLESKENKKKGHE